MGRILSVIATLLLLPLYVWATPPLKVLVSIPPYRQLVQHLGSPHVIVDVLLPSNASDEVFDPTAIMLQKMATTHIFVTTGKLPLEKVLLSRMSQLNPHLMIVNLSKFHKNAEDPHLWLSLKNLQQALDPITQALIALDPAHRKDYLKNNQITRAQLTQLDQKLTQLLASKKGKGFLILHPTLGYFAKDYGLVQLAIHPIEGQSPSIGGLRSTLKRANELHVKVSILQPDTPQKADWQRHTRLLKFNPMAADITAQLQYLATQFRATL